MKPILLLLIASIGLSEDPFALRWASSHATFKTHLINKYAPETGALIKFMTSVVAGLPAALTRAPYEDFDFNCPGSSVLGGIYSEYSFELKRRLFGFHCVFLEDALKNTLSLDQCKRRVLSKTLNTYRLLPAKKPYDNKYKKTGKSQCEENEFGYGLWSQGSREGQVDRDYQVHCCSLKQTAPKPLKVTVLKSACQNITNSSPKSNFDLQCPKDTILHQLTSKYHDDGIYDRTFTIECCQAKFIPGSNKDDDSSSQESENP